MYNKNFFPFTKMFFSPDKMSDFEGFAKHHKILIPRLALLDILFLSAQTAKRDVALRLPSKYCAI